MDVQGLDGLSLPACFRGGARRGYGPVAAINLYGSGYKLNVNPWDVKLIIPYDAISRTL